ncbi:MAG: ATP-binding cassette domain-containing protein [Candidatus Marinimicrobia bacterium]|nr:ATP-binding cassette domain-containing protein [Candidatus Neomarinimicrobiota bacterium]
MLKIDNISKAFTGIKAVDNISLDIPVGEVFGFLGPNGAGKTTTLRMIMDIIQPDSGTITIDGKPSTSCDHTRIGYLPEERGIYQKAKVRDVVEYFGKLKSVHVSEVKERANYWFSRLKIQDLADKKVAELSKGNQQKVQFIIAVINDPVLMILDEPFTGLDPVNQKILQDIIKDFKAQDRTIILSTHQMAKVEENCDSMCLIHKGKIITLGKTKDIMEKHGGSLDKAFIELVGDTDE